MAMRKMFCTLRPCCTVFLYCAGVLLFSSGSAHRAWATATEELVEKPFRAAVDTDQRTQKEEERWREEREALRLRFEDLEKKREQLLSSRDSLAQNVRAGEQRVADKRIRQAEIVRINKEISPFLDNLRAELHQTQAEGLPFLAEERRQRLEKIDQLFADPAVSVAERYRRLMEALLIEAEYGFNTEITQETIDLAGQQTLVDVFRLGRLNLFYLSLDQRHCGFYNEAEQSWQALDARYLRGIRNAVEIGAKRRPVELISLPVGALQAGMEAKP